MMSRRRIAFPPSSGPAAFGFQLRPSKQEFATSDMGRKWSVLRCRNSEPRMSAWGQKPKLPQRNSNVRFTSISGHQVAWSGRLSTRVSSTIHVHCCRHIRFKNPKLSTAPFKIIGSLSASSAFSGQPHPRALPVLLTRHSGRNYDAYGTSSNTPSVRREICVIRRHPVTADPAINTIRDNDILGALSCRQAFLHKKIILSCRRRSAACCSARRCSKSRLPAPGASGKSPAIQHETALPRRRQ
jgi:hypothetical protein